MHASPELFPHPAWRRSASATSADVSTPLGVIRVAARVDEHPLRFDAATLYEDAGTARLWVWDGGVFRAELLRCRPRYLLPAGMTVGGCEAAMWRLRASERPAECQVSCRWAESARVAAGSPESGENLEAQIWSERDQRVAIGTPDLGEAVHSVADGFVVSAPLAAGATFQTHFVVAWSAVGSADEATWFAVDCTAEQVLEGIRSPVS